MSLGFVRTAFGIFLGGFFGSREFFCGFELGFALSLFSGQALILRPPTCSEILVIGRLQICCEVRPLAQLLRRPPGDLQSE